MDLLDAYNTAKMSAEPLKTQLTWLNAKVLDLAPQIDTLEPLVFASHSDKELINKLRAKNIELRVTLDKIQELSPAHTKWLNKHWQGRLRRHIEQNLKDYPAI